jgi:hypothetical protein
LNLSIVLACLQESIQADQGLHAQSKPPAPLLMQQKEKPNFKICERNGNIQNKVGASECWPDAQHVDQKTMMAQGCQEAHTNGVTAFVHASGLTAIDAMKSSQAIAEQPCGQLGGNEMLLMAALNSNCGTALRRNCNTTALQQSTEHIPCTIEDANRFQTGTHSHADECVTRFVNNTAGKNDMSTKSSSGGCKLPADDPEMQSVQFGTGKYIQNVDVDINRHQEYQGMDLVKEKVPSLSGAIRQVASGRLCEAPGSPQASGQSDQMHAAKVGAVAEPSTIKQPSVASVAVCKSTEGSKNCRTSGLDTRAGLCDGEEQTPGIVTERYVHTLTIDSASGTGSASDSMIKPPEACKRRRLDLHAWASSLLQ